ncbi:hypothetical protein [Methylomonas sp. HYX-M1]|uniref:COG4648 family protein n=1 Tax=Methylomonas sp. HYX-M1 TaxID=3139307 RepID=UPI00345B7783
MFGALRGITIAGLFLAYPFLSAYFARQGYAPLVLLTFAALTAWRGWRLTKASWRYGSFALSAMLVIAAQSAASYWIWLLPAAIYLCLACLFGHTLLAPPSLCERLVRLQFPELEPGIAEYLRQVTQAWTWFFALNVPVCAVLPLLAGQQVWAVYTGVLVYLLMGLLVVGEWLYRRKRFPDLYIPPVLETVRFFALNGHKAFKNSGT